MMIITEIETTNDKSLTDKYSYREYGFGSTTTASDSKEFDFYKKYYFLPFENKTVNIKMDVDDLNNLNIKFSEINDYNGIVIKSKETT